MSLVEIHHNVPQAVLSLLWWRNTRLQGQGVPFHSSGTCLSTLHLPGLPRPHNSLCVTPRWVTKASESATCFSQWGCHSDRAPSHPHTQGTPNLLFGWAEYTQSSSCLASLFSPLLGRTGQRERTFSPRTSGWARHSLPTLCPTALNLILFF